MKRVLFFSIVLFALEANAFSALFDPTYSIPIGALRQESCKYVFAFGRNTVVVDSDYGRSQCTFTHPEKQQVPADSTSFRNTLYIYHYSCTDGTAAQYSTNWLGTQHHFLFHIEQGRSIRCD